jgi:hypothetical protein
VPSVLLAVLLGACGPHLPFVSVPPPAAGEIETSVFLIGDAGKPDPKGDPVLQEVTRLATEAPASSVVVFLGDNLYERGMDSGSAEAYTQQQDRLRAQVAVALASGRRAYFVPGNHDWNQFDAAGGESLARSARFLEAEGQGLARQAPAAGCPGPEAVEVGQRLRLVLLDTQWWFRTAAQAAGGGECGGQPIPQDSVFASLGRVLAGAGSRDVILVGHHPLLTAGEHGGWIDPRDALFPLHWAVPRPYKPAALVAQVALHVVWPVSLVVTPFLYPVLRKWVAPALRRDLAASDLANPAYEDFVRRMRGTFRSGQPLIYAAGHEHNLQVLRLGPEQYQVVSGSGYYGHTSMTGHLADTYHAAAKSGFVRLDVLRSGEMRLGVVVVERGSRVSASMRIKPGGG